MSHEAQPAHPTDAAQLHARRREPAIPQATPPPARAPMSVTKVQQWVSSVLAATVIGHLSVGMVFAALYAPKQSSQIGLLIIAGIIGLIAGIGFRAIHQWRILSLWLLVGLAPALVGPMWASGASASAADGCGRRDLGGAGRDKPNVEDMQPSRSGASRGPDQGGQPRAANVATSGTPQPSGEGAPSFATLRQPALRPGSGVALGATSARWRTTEFVDEFRLRIAHRGQDDPRGEQQVS